MHGIQNHVFNHLKINLKNVKNLLLLLFVGVLYLECIGLMGECLGYFWMVQVYHINKSQ